MVQSLPLCIRQLIRRFRPGRNQSFSQQSLVTCSVSRGGITQNFPPSTWSCPLIVPFFSHLCNHFQKRQFHNRPSGMLTFTIFLPFLPWYFLKNRSQSCDVNISTGFSKVCCSLYSTHLSLCVMVLIFFREKIIW